VVKLLPDHESSAHLDTLLRDTVDRVVVAVGPEGGWVDFEIDLMENHGFQRFRLGPWVLRVETAVSAALAQVELLAGRGPAVD
ncbi:MAG: RNA methyltransferase, partial [Candidatus Zixiibacteriota bacterium]